MIHPARIIVIGGSAAGAAAAAKAKRVSPVTDVILFEKYPYISTGVCEIPYVISGDIEDYRKLIFYDPEKFSSEKGVRVFVNHLVESIDRQKKNISVRDLLSGETKSYSYDKLIITTGSKSIELPQFDPFLKNVFYIKSIPDLEKYLEYKKTNQVKSAAVIGAGLLGLEMVDALRSKGIERALFEKNSLPFPSAEKEIQLLVNELLNKKDVSFYSNALDIKPFIDQNKIKSIKLDGRILEYDVYFVTAGVKPDKSLFEKSKIEIGRSGGVRVDNKLCTSDSNIYAAGDCIEVMNYVSRRNEVIPLATLSRDYGHIAGANAAGENIRTNPVVKNISVKIFDNYFASCGITTEEAKSLRISFKYVDASVPNLVDIMPDSEKVYGKILYSSDNKKILGASFFGGRELSGYSDLISGLITAGQNIDVLTKINYNYTPPLSPFKNLLSVLGRKSSNH